ncbi:MAG: YfhO family protein [Anaerorhabdus sp.]|uniref:YfhO family protein n=1 Tax=Anaerorhabdus sp. TaxID=1872524 RepID=UPI002FCBDD0C
MRKSIKSIGLIFLIITIGYGIFLLPYLVTKQPTIMGYDSQQIWHPLYHEFYQLLDNFFGTGELPFYSFNYFLGNNFFASKSFYLMGDVFAYIGYLFKGLNYYDLTIILNYLKFLTSGILMYFLIKEFNYKEKTCCFGAILYSFCSYSVFFTTQSQILSFFALMPLIFIGTERYLRNKKTLFFIFSVFILVINNFYMFYSTSIFLVIYFTYRFYTINSNFKGFIKSSFMLILNYFVGILMASVIFVPSIIFILMNARVGDVQSSQFFFEQFSVYLHLLVSLFTPSHVHIMWYDNTIFNAWYSIGELNLWAGSLVAILLPQLFIGENKFKIKKNILLYSVFILILFIPGLDSMMHGFSEPSFRWTCFIIMMNILLVMEFIDDYTKINFRVLRNTGLILLLICLFAIPLYSVILGKTNELFSIYSKQFILFCFVGVLLYVITLLLRKKNILLVMIFAIIESILFGSIFYYDELMMTKVVTYEFLDNSTHVLEDNEGEFNQYMNSLENANPMEFYRIYVNKNSIYYNYSLNMNVFYQLKGLITYDSTYETSYNQMKKLTQNGDNWWMINVQDPNLITLFNTKYAVVINEEELPKNMDWKLITNNFRGGLSIYRNENYRKFGTPYDNVMSEEEYLTINDTSLFLTSVIAENTDIIEIEKFISDSKSEMENIRYSGNHIFATQKSDKTSFVVTGIPFDKGWKVFNNGKEVETFMVNGGLLGLGLPAGENNIEMYFTPTGFKEGAILSIIGFTIFAILSLVSVVKSKRKFEKNR